MENFIFFTADDTSEIPFLPETKNNQATSSQNVSFSYKGKNFESNYKMDGTSNNIFVMKVICQSHKYFKQ